MKQSLISFLAIFIYGFALAESPFDINRYHSVGEINDYLEKAANTHSRIESKVLGLSEEGVEIKCLIISDGRLRKPLFLNGTHHGNEKSSTNAILAIIQYFVENIDVKDIADLISEHSIVLLPLVNPDGYSQNSRSNTNGFDINRDYSYLNHHPQNTAEARIVEDLTRDFQFTAAMSYHSGMEAVLWPFGYTGERPKDHMVLEDVGSVVARAMGFETATQSFYDYETVGEYIDFSYINYNTISLTVEVSKRKTPPESELSLINAKVIEGLVAFLSYF